MLVGKVDFRARLRHGGDLQEQRQRRVLLYLRHRPVVQWDALQRLQPVRLRHTSERLHTNVGHCVYLPDREDWEQLRDRYGLVVPNFLCVH